MTLGSLYNDSGSDYENYQRRLSSDLFKDGKSSLRNDGTSRMLQSLASPNNAYNQFPPQEVDDYASAMNGYGNGDVNPPVTSSLDSSSLFSSFNNSEYLNDSKPQWPAGEAEEQGLYNGIPRTTPESSRPGTAQPPTREEASTKYKGLDGNWYTGKVPTQQTKRDLTLEEQINEEFSDYMDALAPMSTVQRDAYLNNSTPEKQILLSNQKARSPIFEVKYFMDGLRPHYGSTKGRSKKTLDKQKQLSTTLRHLKVDLLMSQNSFVFDFVTWRHGPNGIVALLGVLADIKAEQRHLTNSSKGAKNLAYANKLLNDECDTLTSLQFSLKSDVACEKLIDTKSGVILITESLTSKFMKSRVVTLKILNRLCEVKGGFYKVLESMTDMRIRHKQTIHFQAVISVMQKQTDAPMDNTFMPFLIESMRFLNNILSLSESSNTRVYIQHEVSIAGFDIERLALKARGNSQHQKDLTFEIRRWKQHYIDTSYVTKLGQDVATDWNRSQILREEVDRLQDQIRMLQDDFMMIEQDKIDEMERNEGYKHMVLNLQDTVEKLNNMYINATGIAPTTDQIDIQIARQPLDMPSYMMPVQTNRRVYRPEKRQFYHYEPNKPARRDDSSSSDDDEDYDRTRSNSVRGDHGGNHGGGHRGSPERSGGDGGGEGGGEGGGGEQRKRKKGRGKKGRKKRGDDRSDSSSSESSSSEEETGILFPGPAPSPKRKPIVVPAPPIAPMMAPPPGEEQDRVQPNVPLPFFNWTPLHNTSNTVFDGMEDVIGDIDFDAFEEEFKLPNRDNNPNIHITTNPKTKQKVEKVLFVQVDRARNMIITKRKLDLDHNETNDAIRRCDISKIPGEFAKMMLKYVPTEEELANIEENKDRYSRMGDAEQYLTQISKVDRLQEKLNVMAFMGLFDEYQESLQPQIESILWSSNTLLRNEKFSQVLAIVLAFGNYMNSHKRGVAKGFKIESLNKLLDVKSTDRRKTLMNYLSQLIEAEYPELLNFYEDMKIDVPRGVSYQAIHDDINWLRKGLDLVRNEKLQQPENENLQEFYNHAHVIVMSLGELFRKMDEAYQSACAFFGEKHKHTDPNDFFTAITAFIENFKRSIEENKKQKYEKQGLTISGPLPSSVNILNAPTPKVDLEAPKVVLKHVDHERRAAPQFGKGLTPIEVNPTETVVARVEEFEQIMDGEEPMLLRPGLPEWGYKEPPKVWGEPPKKESIQQRPSSSINEYEAPRRKLSEQESLSSRSSYSSVSSFSSAQSYDRPPMRLQDMPHTEEDVEHQEPICEPSRQESQISFNWDDVPVTGQENASIADSISSYSMTESEIEQLYARPKRSSGRPSIVPSSGRSSLGASSGRASVAPSMTSAVRNALDMFDLALEGESDAYSMARSVTPPPVPRKQSDLQQETPPSSRTITPVPTPRSSKLQSLLDDVERRRSRFEPPGAANAQGKGPAPLPPTESPREKRAAPPPPPPESTHSDVSYEEEGPQRLNKTRFREPSVSSDDSGSTMVDGYDMAPPEPVDKNRRKTPYPGQYDPADDSDESSGNTTPLHKNSTSSMNSTTSSVTPSTSSSISSYKPTKGITFDDDATSEKSDKPNKYERRKTPFHKSPYLEEFDDDSIASTISTEPSQYNVSF